LLLIKRAQPVDTGDGVGVFVTQSLLVRLQRAFEKPLRFGVTAELPVDLREIVYTLQGLGMILPEHLFGQRHQLLGHLDRLGVLPQADQLPDLFICSSDLVRALCTDGGGAAKHKDACRQDTSQ
jgi:hypothetical protein